MPIYGKGINEPQVPVQAKPNRLFYLGALASILSLLALFAFSWRAIPIWIGFALILGVLGLMGKLDVLEPVWTFLSAVVG